MKIDKAFYERVLEEYNASIQKVINGSSSPKFDSDILYMLYMCNSSESFKKRYDMVRGKSKIRLHAKKFIQDCDIDDFIIGSHDVLLLNDYLPAKAKISVRIQFLNYMVNQYSWEE